MGKLQSLQGLYNEKGKEFIAKLFNKRLIIKEMIDGTKIRIKKVDKSLVFYKGNDKNPINIIDRTVMVYYENLINHFKTIESEIIDYIPLNWEFEFRYLNQNKITVKYDNLPLNYLILTSIRIIDSSNKFQVIDDIQILEKWSKLLQVDNNGIIFDGRLNNNQKQQIFDFLETDEEDLINLFKSTSFIRYIISILNIPIKSTLLNNSLDNMIEGVLLEFKDGLKTYTVKLEDPLYTEQILQNRDKQKPNDTYQIILLDLIAFLSNYSFDNIHLTEQSPERRYIEMISKIFNDYIKKNMFKYIGMDFQTPEFAQNDEFKLNTKFITNKVTANYLTNEYLHDLFKIILSSFKKKRKYSTDLLSAETITVINKTIDIIQDKINSNQSSNKVLDFKSYINSNNDSQNNIFENLTFESLSLNSIVHGTKKVNIFVGRFQPFTLGHIKVLKKLHKANGLDVVILIVRGQKHDFQKRPFSEKIQMQLFKAIKSEYKFIEDAIIIHNAAPDTIFNALRPKYEPVLWGVGTDRVDSYSKMINKYKSELNSIEDFNTYEIKRDDNNISATKVRQAIIDDDEESFKSNTPKSMHKFFKKLKDILIKLPENRILSFNEYLNENMNARERNIFIRDFIKDNHKNYDTHSTPGRIKVKNKTSFDSFVKDIKNYIKKSKDYEVTGPFIIVEPKGTPNIIGLSRKYKDDYSSKYPTLEFEVNGDQMFITYTNILESSKGTSTNLKESLVNYFFKNNQWSKVTKANYDDELNLILNNIKKNGIEGIDKKTILSIQKELEYSLEEYKVNLVKSINNAKSIGKYLAESNYKDWKMDRDVIFNKIKKVGSQVSKLYADKWNPSDIILYKPQSESHINQTLKEAQKEANQELSLGHINGLFVNQFDDTSNYVLGISLKEQKSQAGKAKSYLKSIQIKEGSELKHYNLTPEEDDLNIGEYYSKIEDYRKKIDKIIKKYNNLFKYQVDSKFTSSSKSKNIDFTRAKYAALKMLYFLLEQNSIKDNIFVNLASYGLSLGKNPTFFKIKGNNNVETPSLTEFPAQSGVEIVDNNSQILLIDKNTYNGINVDYHVKFKDTIYKVRIMIRINGQGSIVTVEINEFKKIS